MLFWGMLGSRPQAGEKLGGARFRGILLDDGWDNCKELDTRRITC